MSYRVYLLDETQHIRAAESFSAASDYEAVGIGSAVYDACSDVFVGCEIWRGSAVLAKISAASLAHVLQADFADGLLQAQQQVTLDLEERLARSFAAVRESKRMLAATQHLAGAVTERDAAESSD